MAAMTLCVAYGLTTPVSIGIGLAVRDTYNAGSAESVSGLFVLDCCSDEMKGRCANTSTLAEHRERRGECNQCWYSDLQQPCGAACAGLSV